MNSPPTGIHHITAITADAQKNIDFYCGLLGLRLVKLTVNFDDPASYHLYYGDELGRPGTIMTFFAWPGAPRGRQGPPQVTAFSYSIPDRSLDYWRERLGQAGVEPSAPIERFGDRVIGFADPDGTPVEMVATRVQDRRAPWDAGPVPVSHAIRGFHGVTLSEEGYERTAGLLTGTMRLERLADDGGRFRYALGAGPDRAGSIVDVVCRPDSAPGALGAGVVHHVALRVPDDAAQREWRQTLVRGGFNVSPVMDRGYFHSIYFREPGGVLFELATDNPGFATDEAPERLGTSLKLPPRYELLRPRIEAVLPPVRLPAGAGA